MHALFLVCSLRDNNAIISKPTWKSKRAYSILEPSEYFYQISSKSIHTISSYTVAKFGRFFETQCTVALCGWRWNWRAKHKRTKKDKTRFCSSSLACQCQTGIYQDVFDLHFCMHLSTLFQANLFALWLILYTYSIFLLNFWRHLHFSYIFKNRPTS